MKLFLQLLALCAVLSQLVGCGGGARGSLAGKVTLDGEPVTEGSVIFTTGDSSQNGLAAIQSDGTYKADSVPLGEVRVAVSVPPGGASSMPPGATAKSPSGIPADHPQAKLYADKGSKKGFNVPKAYSDPATSNLTVKVEGGQQTFDIPLKSAK